MNDEPEIKILKEEELEKKICVVIGTRPGIIMLSPILREFYNQGINFFVVHTGQHYSYNMDRKFFEDLNLREPEFYLDTVRYCKYHGEQTAEMLKGVERILLKERPKIVLVGGDANTNLAGALAARKLRIRVGHIEAGERSGDWRMPEEHNRVIIDHISDYLFVTNKKGEENLIKDNVKGEIFITGNPIVDALYQNLKIAKETSTILEEFNLEPNEYFILTLHREENVDSRENLKNVIKGMNLIYEKFGKKIIFLAHPRTQKRMKQFKLEGLLNKVEGLEIRNAIGYLDFLRVLSNANLVLTDSGGVQQESCILKVPCVTLRDNTEWVETIEEEANILAGTNPERILKGVEKMLNVKRNWKNPFGDGRAAQRISDILVRKLEK